MKTLVFSFGRMNPITNGHEKLVKKVQEVARKERADAKIFLSHSQDAKKNPLSYADKIKYAQKAFGKVIQKSASKQIFQILKEIDADYDNIIMVVGADRISEFETIINKYNGKGDYEFKSVKVVSSGDRVDPDSEEAKKLTADAMSASVMRKLAAENDFESFKKGAPSKLSEKDVKGLFDAVRKGMNLKEGYMLDEALNRKQRLAKSRVFKRLKSRIAIARRRAMKRKATLDKIKVRAKKQARNLVRARLSKGMGGNYQDLSYASREMIDKKLEKKRAFIQKLAVRMIPKVRQKEAERFRRMNESLDFEFESMILNEAVEELFEVKQDKDIKDREGSQPAKYYAGDMSKSTKEKRAAHFNKGKKKDDNDPSAYEPAPGDASAKTKESEYTKKYKEKYGEEVEISESADKSLQKKADKSGISVGILKQVYKRGVAAWRTGHRPGTTPEQWGHARVNSFIVGGKTRTTADADLWKKHKGN
jgi:phosphopantetheine adenylyltransferase